MGKSVEACVGETVAGSAVGDDIVGTIVGGTDGKFECREVGETLVGRFVSDGDADTGLPVIGD